MMGMVLPHVIIAIYKLPITSCDQAEAGNFFQVGIPVERYKDVWSALRGCKKPSEVFD